MDNQTIHLENDCLFGFSQFDEVGDDTQDIRELHSKSDETKPPMNPVPLRREEKVEVEVEAGQS